MTTTDVDERRRAAEKRLAQVKQFAEALTAWFAEEARPGFDAVRIDEPERTVLLRRTEPPLERLVIDIRKIPPMASPVGPEAVLLAFYRLLKYAPDAQARIESRGDGSVVLRFVDGFGTTREQDGRDFIDIVTRMLTHAVMREGQLP